MQLPPISRFKLMPPGSNDPGSHMIAPYHSYRSTGYGGRWYTLTRRDPLFI